MLHCKNTIQETHYEILSIKEDATYEEIRTSYRVAILNYHPDKLHNTPDSQIESGDRFFKVQKAWEILGNAKSRSVYDSELRGSRKDTAVAEDVSLEDMGIEDSGGDLLELFYQCRCGDYFSVGSLELGKMGYRLLRDENNMISFETSESDSFPASVVLPCGSCSLQVRLLINTGVKVQIDDKM